MNQITTCLFTVVDRFTRWPEAIPLASIDTESCDRALARHWIARFGVPGDMSSNRGAQLTSDLWASLSNLLGIRLHRTTAYHPQANGLVERFHRSRKASLRAGLTSAAWMDELPWVLLGLWTMPKDDLGTSSAEMVYGAPLTVPGDFISPPTKVNPAGHLRQLRGRVRALAPVPTALHGQLHRQTSVPASLATTRFIFVRRDEGKRSPYRRPTPVHTGSWLEVTKPSPSTTAAERRLSASTASSRPTRIWRPLSKRPNLHDMANHLKDWHLHLQPKLPPSQLPHGPTDPQLPRDSPASMPLPLCWTLAQVMPARGGV